MTETVTRYLSQMMNAERWYSQEIERLKAEGHKIIGDSVIIKVRNQDEAISRLTQSRPPSR